MSNDENRCSVVCHRPPRSATTSPPALPTLAGGDKQYRAQSLINLARLAIMSVRR